MVQGTNGILSPTDQIAVEITEPDVTFWGYFAETSGGIRVAGDAANVTLVTHVENSRSTAILVEGNARVTVIGSRLTNVGSAPIDGRGVSSMLVRGHGRLRLAPVGSRAINIANSPYAGIRVEEVGSLEVDSWRVPGFDGVYLYDNLNGIMIEQNPSPVPPRNELLGITALSRLRLEPQPQLTLTAGSNVRARNLNFLSLGLPGIRVVPYVRGGMRSNDVSLIDLGTAEDPGRNRFNGEETAGRDVSLCVELDTVLTPQTLRARGNLFPGGDCLTSPSPVLRRGVRCTATDFRSRPDLAVLNSGTVVDTGACSQAP